MFVPGGELSVVEQRTYEAGIKVKKGDVLFFIQGGNLAEVGLDKVNLKLKIVALWLKPDRILEDG